MALDTIVGKVLGREYSQGNKADGSPWERWSIKIQDTTGQVKNYSTFDKEMAGNFTEGDDFRFSYSESPGTGRNGQAITYRNLEAWLGASDSPVNQVPASATNNQSPTPPAPAKEKSIEQTMMPDHPSKRKSIERQHAISAAINYHTAKASLPTLFETAERIYRWTAEIEQPSVSPEKPDKDSQDTAETQNGENPDFDPIFSDDEE